jgi:predicted secreted protein
MAKLGNTHKLYLTTGTAYTYVKGETSSSLNLSSDSVEVSDKESRWKKFIAGLIGGTADATLYAENDENSAQHQLLTALHKGEVVKCFIGELGEGNAPLNGDAFEALVTSIGGTFDNGAVVSRSVSLQITGEVTHYPSIV